ncbi:MAG: DUF1080 domain-containing protein [Pseudomonadota bacterium]
MTRAIKAALLLSLALASAPGQAKGRWQPLFDGKTLNGWTPKIRGLPLGQDDKKVFTVKDGVIHVSHANYAAFDMHFAHLFYHTPFKAFRLQLDYRFLDARPPGVPDWATANSGIMFDSQPPETMPLDQAFPISVEFQLLGKVDDKDRPTGAVCTPGTIVSIGGVPQTEHCIQPSNAQTIAPGIWVRAELRVDAKGHVTQLINDRIVAEYDDVALAPDELDGSNPMYKAMFPGGVSLKTLGHYVALQGEGQDVEFRNIRVMPLR